MYSAEHNLGRFRRTSFFKAACVSPIEGYYRVCVLIEFFGRQLTFELACSRVNL